MNIVPPEPGEEENIFNNLREGLLHKVDPGTEVETRALIAVRGARAFWVDDIGVRKVDGLDENAVKQKMDRMRRDLRSSPHA